MAEQLFDPVALLAALRNAGVRFVLIGGMAAVLHGDVGVTVDIDIAPARDSDNKDRLALPRLHELLERTSAAQRDRG
ncbi:MAG: hypothetical protein OXF93_23715 [Acidobacteria bacterium]|nr:hypothetical protein [Acidobacteriota bacterium]